MDNLLIQGDCLEVMSEFPDGYFDAIITDLPYGITACKWDSIIPLEPMWAQLKRIIKPKGAIVLFESQPFTSVLINSNLDMFKYEWIWNKSKITGVLNAKIMPVRKHEQILIFEKNKMPNYYPQYINKGCIEVVKQGSNSNNYGERNKKEYIKENSGCPRDVLDFKSQGKTIHPTQKPVALLEYLIKTYTLENEVVLDFTMGSGTAGVACKNLNRQFVGIEKDEKYFEVAKGRIND